MLYALYIHTGKNLQRMQRALGSVSRVLQSTHKYMHPLTNGTTGARVRWWSGGLKHIVTLPGMCCVPFLLADYIGLVLEQNANIATSTPASATTK